MRHQKKQAPSGRYDKPDGRQQEEVMSNTTVQDPAQAPADGAVDGSAAPASTDGTKQPKRTRNSVLRDLYLAGWDGPVSYPREKLEEMLDDIRSGWQPQLPQRGRAAMPKFCKVCGAGLDAESQAAGTFTAPASASHSPADSVSAGEIGADQPGTVAQKQAQAHA